jgi:hypothetical protein
LQVVRTKGKKATGYGLLYMVCLWDVLRAKENTQVGQNNGKMAFNVYIYQYGFSPLFEVNTAAILGMYLCKF